MKTLDDIFEQDGAIGALRRAYGSDRLPHGLIFAGPGGVGKATTAEALGGLFLCESPRGWAACGVCGSCRSFAAGTHPDYHLITRQLVKVLDKNKAASVVSVDVIRRFLLEPAGRKPMLNRGKVFVVEEAEYMNPAAQNSMLKTLEEPAGRTLIVLLTDQPDGLLATIRSRCQLVRFGAISLGRVEAELQRRGVSAGLASAAARYTEGSLGVALQWVREGTIESAQAIERQIDELVGGKLRGDPAEWFTAPAERDVAELQKADEDLSKTQATREALGRYLRIAATVFRHRLAEAEDDGAREAICAAIDALAQAKRYLDANVTISLIFQQLAVTLESLFMPARSGR